MYLEKVRRLRVPAGASFRLCATAAGAPQPGLEQQHPSLARTVGPRPGRSIGPSRLRGGLGSGLGLQKGRRAATQGHWHWHCGQLPVSAAGLGAGGCQFPPVTAGPGTAARPRRLQGAARRQESFRRADPGCWKGRRPLLFVSLGLRGLICKFRRLAWSKQVRSGQVYCTAEIQDHEYSTGVTRQLASRLPPNCLQGIAVLAQN